MDKLREEITVSRGILWLLGGISPLTLMIGLFYLGAKMNNYETRMFRDASEKERVTGRALDNTLHYRYDVQSQQFVPRNELEYVVDHMKGDMNDLKEDLKDIKRALRIKE